MRIRFSKEHQSDTVAEKKRKLKHIVEQSQSRKRSSQPTTSGVSALDIPKYDVPFSPESASKLSFSLSNVVSPLRSHDSVSCSMSSSSTSVSLLKKNELAAAPSKSSQKSSSISSTPSGAVSSLYSLLSSFSPPSHSFRFN
jgi:hypothetical protein